MRRRHFLLAGAVAPVAVRAAEPTPEETVERIRAGGVVVAFRHALAPGTFDPPEFRLGDCSTQRNLSQDGRAQARRLGEWFRTQRLAPSSVRSSPWCRCMDTATLAFGQAEAWSALGSPRGTDNERYSDQIAALRQALVDARTRPGQFQVWVTHMFVLNDLVGVGTGSGDGLVLQAADDGAPRILARLSVG